MPPRRMSREESWQSLHRSEVSADNEDEVSTDVSMEDGNGDENNEETVHSSGPAYATISDVRKSMHPLQATADRVGQQVEEFAKSLDRLTSKTKEDPTKDCRRALPFVKEYQRIAHITVKRLKTIHGSEKKSRSRSKSRRSDVASTAAESQFDQQRLTTVEDLERWEEEEQSWDLLGSMLQLEFPVPTQDRPSLDSYQKTFPSMVRPLPNSSLHQYSTERDIWDDFLAVDDLAWERHTVLEWLKCSAEKSRPDIDTVVEELESKADRGSGLWAHSWLYTKEAIKGQKRLRSWPQALEPDSPGLNTSLTATNKKSALVTQLDPDAISRQGRELEKQDTSFERAIWVACWEMLRRGKDWNTVHSWFLDRGELWRSTAMRSLFIFQQASSAAWQTRDLWRKTCAVAAKSGGNDDFEKAVYGVLSGYLPSVLNVVHTWADNLFAYYNSYLLHSFDRYLKVNRPDRVSALPSDIFRSAIFSGQSALSGNQIVERLKLQSKVQEEALKPFKWLQGSLIAKSFEEFAFKHGVRITRVANKNTKSKTIMALPLELMESTQTAAISMEDYDFLRILTHMILIFKGMGYDFGGQRRRYAVDSIIVAYIEFLSQAGKQQLIPLYAARLESNRCVNCMSRQLPFILNSDERKITMKLMSQYGIDVHAVLAVQLRVIMEDKRPRLENSKSYERLEIFESVPDGISQPYHIKSNFIGDVVTDEQYDLIHGLEWFMLLEGYWLQSMFYGAEVYKFFMSKMSALDEGVSELKQFLGQGALAAARRLSRSVTFSQFSLSKTQAILGTVTDISQEKETIDDEEGSRTSPRKSKTRRAKNHQSQNSGAAPKSKLQREVLMVQGQSYLDLEHLFNALDAIQHWKELASEAER